MRSLKFLLTSILAVLFIATAKAVPPKKCSARLARPDSIILTTSLTPKRFNVTLNDLPEPFASDSASKFPQVIPIPTNASLKVPNGFSVNVFESNLTTPRWLALTPNGEVLITQTSLNRISILIDEDDDGTANVNEIFAGLRSGLNRSLWNAIC